MILQALTEYYDRKAADPDSGIAPPGWERKELPFLIVLKPDGTPIDIEDTREPDGKKLRAKSFLVPQSVKRSVGISANLLWDNAEYTLGIACKGKPERVIQLHEAFRARLNDFSTIPAVNTLMQFLAHTDKEAKLSKYSAWTEIKETCAFLSFKVVGSDTPIFRDPLVIEKVNRMCGKASASKSICLVTGTNDFPESLHPVIKGVQGTNTTGGNIVAFNFGAAESFGKKQGLNAPVGKNAVFAYTTALNTLLSKDSPQKLQVGDATTVFWASKDTPFENQFHDFFGEPPKDNPDALTTSVKALFKSVENGAFAVDADTTQFYVLGLSPNSARISVRFWHKAPVTELASRFCQYFEDLRIVHGTRDQDDLSLWRLLISTAVQGKSENISPNLAGNVMQCILEGLPFPETLLQAALLRVKAERDVTYPRAKLIKGCLNRKLRKTNPNNERSLTMALDKDNTDAAYRLGRLFAVLEKIQQEANPGINATIRDKFYAAASSTPATVFGNLMRLKNHHLSKLENPGHRIWFEKILGDILSEISPSFPAHLKLEAQGRFAIGYYHQVQDFWTKKIDKETV